MRTRLTSLVLAAALILPSTAFAATTPELGAKLDALLATFQNIQSSVVQFEASTSIRLNLPNFASNLPYFTGSNSPISATTTIGSFTTGTTTGPTLCFSPAMNLGPGSSDATTGGAVTGLQMALLTVFNLPAAQVVTGTYDPLTEGLVQALQTQNGIVSTGTPTTTGFGAVGPRTRIFLGNFCNHGGPVPVIGTPASSL